MTNRVLSGIVVDSREGQALTCSTGRGSLRAAPESAWLSVVCLTLLLYVLPTDEGV